MQKHERKLSKLLKSEAEIYVIRRHGIAKSANRELVTNDRGTVWQRLEQERILSRIGSCRYDPDRHLALLQRLRCCETKKAR